jgi:hypothetical protein
MKKAALTIGLFSLVVITTSFTTPETINKYTSNEELSIIPPIEGNGTQTGRHKSDFADTENQSGINVNLSSNFNADRQSVRMNVKID